jgi:acyl carrier protein
MSRDELLGVLQEAFDLVGTKPFTLTGSERIPDDLALDSLQMIELLSEIEERLGIVVVGDARLFDVEKVDDLIGLLGDLLFATSNTP